jgi:hypothetical protein
MGYPRHVGGRGRSLTVAVLKEAPGSGLEATAGCRRYDRYWPGWDVGVEGWVAGASYSSMPRPLLAIWMPTTR